MNGNNLSQAWPGWLRHLLSLTVALGLTWGAQAAAPLRVQFDDSPVAAQGPSVSTFAPVVQKVSQSVVNIYTLKKLSTPDLSGSLRAALSGKAGGSKVAAASADEEDEFVEYEERVSSGVIISEDGFLITNAHVVENAVRVRVVLADGSEFLPRIAGVDKATDLAVLKLPGSNFAPIIFANSDNLRVGDVALTLGNPYGIGQTVSMGIISATGRGGFGILDYEDFIQTDASVNPGNSGGALIDAQGRLVGINTAIMSISGSNQGIGFAIPSNMARTIASQLAAHGKVTRSYLGMVFLPLSRELVSALDLPTTKGVLVAGVAPGSPAAKAGIKSGDVLTAVNGAPAMDTRRLQAQLAHLPLDRELKLTVLAKGKAREFSCKPCAEPVDAKLKASDSGGTDLANVLQKLLR